MLSVGILHLAFETRLIAFNSDSSSGTRFPPSENIVDMLFCIIVRFSDY